MFKEKLLKISSMNNKKKIENLIFIVILLIITVISINVIWKEDENKVEKTDKELIYDTNLNNIEDSLEKKIANILTNINGVGKVEVLITYNETEEIVPVYNKTDKKSITNETDSTGGTRTIEEKDIQEEVVYQNNQIVTQKTISPKIEGAIITATGAGNAEVKSNIIQAVEAVTGISTHKIQVFEQKNK